MVNGIPKRGLVAGRTYWVLAESDLVGDLVGGTPPTKTHLGQAKYLAPFQVTTANPSTSGSSPFLTLPVCPIAGTGFSYSRHVGGGQQDNRGSDRAASTAAEGAHHVIAFKATGTSGITEIGAYQDYGAAHLFDYVDFGLPTTYPRTATASSTYLIEPSILAFRCRPTRF